MEWKIEFQCIYIYMYVDFTFVYFGGGIWCMMLLFLLILYDVVLGISFGYWKCCLLSTGPYFKQCSCKSSWFISLQPPICTTLQADICIWRIWVFLVLLRVLVTFCMFCISLEFSCTSGRYCLKISFWYRIL